MCAQAVDTGTANDHEEEVPKHQTALSDERWHHVNVYIAVVQIFLILNVLVLNCNWQLLAWVMDYDIHVHSMHMNE